MQVPQIAQQKPGLGQGSSSVVPYDENLLERARTQWQFGDWQSLAKLDREQLQHHPDRARLALLAAAGRLQTGNQSEARQFVRLAEDWGVQAKLVGQILVAGVFNSLGRAAAVSNQQARALKHFENAITIGTPGTDAKLLTQARSGEQLAQLGLLASNDEKSRPRLGEAAEPNGQEVKTLAAAIERQKAELEVHLKKQADELIRVRKFLDAVVKREVGNATKQIEASVGLQGYFATGQLPNVNIERHTWPVSPDFALFLVELIELNDYDLVIEFGSGISTVVAARALARTGNRRKSKLPPELISFDHLEQYYKLTLAQLEQAGVAEAVRLHFTPLQDYSAPDGTVYSYYGCQSVLSDVAQRQTLDGLRVLVIVDGPPGATGPRARYPAGPIIFNLFQGARIDLLLDDFIRDDEKEVAKLWQAELHAAGIPFAVTEYKLEKDACLITADSRRESQ